MAELKKQVDELSEAVSGLSAVIGDLIEKQKATDDTTDLQNEVYNDKNASLEKRLEDTIEIEWHQSVRIDSLVNELFYTKQREGIFGCGRG